MLKYKMIVARYNEDVSWSQKYDSLVYNKGVGHIEKSIKLDNVGRESHTYLRHIITNYHNMEELLVFVQGNPFEHELNFESLFNPSEDGYSDSIQDMTNNRWGDHMSNKEDFTISDWKGGVSNPKGYLLKDWWEQTTGEMYIRSPKVFWCGVFSIRKDLILKRSLESYIRIYQSLLHDVNPIEGHYCERTWFNIFNIK